MANSRKTWISILIAAVIVVAVLSVAMVGGTAFFFYRHISTESITSEHAADEFARARQRFAGRQPLIELKNDGPVVRRSDHVSTETIASLRVLVYNDGDGKLVRVNVPFWLLRLAPSKNVRILDGELDFDADEAQLTVGDLQGHGPGLILDQRNHHGLQVLVWTE